MPTTSRKTASVHQKQPPASTATCSAMTSLHRLRMADRNAGAILEGLFADAGLERGHLVPLADPFGQLLELQRLVEHDARLAVGEPAHLAADGSQALDDHHHLLAEAIFLDRLDLHPAERNVVGVDRVIAVVDFDVGLAVDLQARRARPEAVARLAAGEQLAEVDVLVELEAC